jgi:hypothetical protein
VAGVTLSRPAQPAIRGPAAPVGRAAGISQGRRGPVPPPFQAPNPPGIAPRPAGSRASRPLLYRFDRNALQLKPYRAKIRPRARHPGVEHVNVGGRAEEREARRIIRRIHANHNVLVNSNAGVLAVRGRYHNAPLPVRNAVAERPWTLTELRAIEGALNFYQDVTGARRTRAGPQEITTVSAVNNLIDVNTAAGAASDDLAETFPAYQNISFSTAGHGYHAVFPTADAETRGTATHEGAHGLLEARWLAYFIANTNYWATAVTPTGAAGAEDPPTVYGQSSAAEDFGDSMALFQQGMLSNVTHPLRHAVCTHIMANPN